MWNDRSWPHILTWISSNCDRYIVVKAEKGSLWLLPDLHVMQIWDLLLFDSVWLLQWVKPFETQHLMDAPTFYARDKQEKQYNH